MFLKKIEIHGFKSFPDRLALQLDTGITSFVGPNGSGKSNIADAIRWVLGEQSAKMLRGSKMEDIIFAGSENRRPVGYAEVIAVFDNADRAIPIEYTEVTITRRVYRSGESEYYINKSSCRLKDINELFMDTGVGKEGYSIIGQGKIDEILSARKEERRSIFEEASGIMKYKLKKLETEKKLYDTEQNLLRINDILTELETQIVPLEKSAKKAREYLLLKEEQKLLDTGLFILNIKKIKETAERLNEQYETVNKNREEHQNSFSSLLQQEKDINLRLGIIDSRNEKAIRNFYDLENIYEKKRAYQDVLDERKNSLEENLSRLDFEAKKADKDVSDLNEQVLKKQKSLSLFIQKEEEFYKKCGETENRFEELKSYMDENEKKTAVFRNKQISLMDSINDKKNMISANEAFIQNILKRMNSVNNELKQIELDEQNIEYEIEEVNDSIKNIAESLNIQKSKIEKLEKEEKETKEMFLQKQRERELMLREKSSLGSRHRVLSDMENSMDGYIKSVKEIINSKEKIKNGDKILGVLAKLINVQEGYEVSVEMALGQALQNIVTEDEYCARDCVDFLKVNNLGRCTFLPVSSIKSRYPDKASIDRAKTVKGFYGRASDFIKCSEKIKDIVENLSGRIFIASDMDSAIEIAKKTDHQYRIVTFDGDTINAGGSITGGSRDPKNTGILTRQREISDLFLQLENLNKEVSQMEQDISNLQKISDDIAVDLLDLRSNFKKTETEKIVAENRLKSFFDSRERLSSRKLMLEGEKTEIEREKENTQNEKQKYVLEAINLEKELSDVNTSILQFAEKYRDRQKEKDDIQEMISKLKVKLAEINHQKIRETDEIENINKNILHIRSEYDKKLNEIDKSKTAIDDIKMEKIAIDNEIKSLNEKKAGTNLEIKSLEEEKKAAAEDLDSLKEQKDSENKTLELLKEESSKLDIKKVKLESEIDSIKQKMWEDYEITYENIRETYKESENINRDQRRISEIKQIIREMGEVSVNAIEEFKQVSERFTFIKAQKEDVEETKTKLSKMINETTKIMRERFLEQFTLINESFNVVFKEIFDGGKAELTLSDTDDVLESGVEINAQPPGKTLQSMTLFSGGERALIAICLLFSILRLKPSPFCLLDEIEAALDDTNVVRFSEFLNRYKSSTQFIVITHKKGTMESSDIIYGVTMQEPGVSKVVSMKF